ncbi:MULTISPECIES: SusD/RagB family nutrient-binding outer membrane lipoprotein [unclassified Tenacibaculum]|uniref:SusD/RagB family nutrient-binding outer membrane lipoprotein n=1 Tax=unclassified Tenacibaculum TaxID=2635139 RepID=UPI001F321998|nr:MULTISPECIES: SusD/RagB family nutrient-binding outer membrane lipoprotein [unclassified Tenacibaculum]MCF2873300.1 SusD/RagB family nutrient-binding outer membrane lipoprotein [Tenacibaculum sp. Cn5-1]MCF2933456.1 SusD/RagB family nutrient-binding outer membrane lipoprotein [Tenacibaculum sp. Cn5-34]MCG7509963.1 SusD/RagB family nutrient-binding outer membrane lipoprotein [Tenacibaculum sp. Cn5-46]
MKNNNIKNNTYNHLIAIIMIVTMFSCSNLTMDELSRDPNNPTEANLDLLITNAQADIAGAFGYNWDRYAGTFVQTFAGNHAIGVNADRYQLTSNDFTGFFNVPYRTGMKDAYEIIRVGTASEQWQHVAMAKVMMATMLGALTDVYGNIPYSEAFQGVLISQPKYDTQESIYNAIFSLLEGAITDFNKTPSTPVNSSQDIIYKGNINQWKAAANLLLARYHNHLSKKDPSGSATKALSYVDAAINLGMNNSGNFDFNYDGTSNWQNPWYVLYENNLIVASNKFMTLLKDTNDPRLRAYWDNKPFNYPLNGGVLGYIGKNNGDPTGGASYSPVGPSTYYGKKASPQLIATYFELRFIEAEAAMRANNPGRAATALNAAINTQLDLVTPTVVSLITAEGGDIPAYNAQIDAYKTLHANETASTVTMEKIMTEKYKAMFTMNLETWTDMRRHNFSYPGNGYLSLPNNATLANYIRRGLYPQSELDFNSSNVPSGITMTDRLWWDE